MPFFCGLFEFVESATAALYERDCGKGAKGCGRRKHKKEKAPQRPFHPAHSPTACYNYTVRNLNLRQERKVLRSPQTQICNMHGDCIVRVRDSAKQASSRHAAAALSRMAVVVVAVYIAAQMAADIASLKIGVVAGLAVDMGTFVYPVTFTLRDLVHKTLGKRNAQVLIVAAAVINLGMVLYLMWSASVPSDPDSFGGAEFSAIFAPLWRIVCASIAAELVSELVDTEIYHLFVSRVTTRFQWLRVLVSNSVSVPVDNLIFVLIAFSPFAFLGAQFVDSWTVAWEIFVFNLAVKYGVTVVSMPLIYLTPDRDWTG